MISEKHWTVQKRRVFVYTHRLVRLIILGVVGMELLVAITGPAQAQSGTSVCSLNQSSPAGTTTDSNGHQGKILNLTGPFSLGDGHQLYTFFRETTPGAVSGSWNIVFVVLVTGCGNTNLLNFTDGRCNQEPWQSFAVYPDGKGGVIIRAINNGIGYPGVSVSKGQFKNNPDTGVNHLIAQGNGVQVYRLAGGVIQVHRIGMGGKDYLYNIGSDCAGQTP
jgi:hypothetical protein